MGVRAILTVVTGHADEPIRPLIALIVVQVH
jgi:hypothetical protein